MISIILTNGDRQDIQTADSFGISPAGDLIVVKMVAHPIGAGQMGTIGENMYAFAKGAWRSVEVTPNKLQTIK